MVPLHVVVLAAGLGKRMRSTLPKVLHPLCGRPMLEYGLRAVLGLRPAQLLVVVGPNARAIRQRVTTSFGDRVQFVVQEERLGTGHALLQAASHLRSSDGTVLVLNGDQPLLTSSTLRRVVEVRSEQQARMTLLAASLQDPAGYGRLLRDRRGQVCQIVEERDASPQERLVQEVNTGVYAFCASSLLAALSSLDNRNAQREYYLPDLWKHFYQQEQSLAVVDLEEPTEAFGINDRSQLALVEGLLRHRILQRHWELGVTIVDPHRTYIEDGVRIGRDTVLAPDTFLRGETEVGERCSLGPGADVMDSVLGDAVRLSYSVALGVRIGTGVKVGPFAYLRPGTELAEEAVIGAFVDLKNTRLGSRSKVSHLAYLGDASVGCSVNIGCGAVTVNYDGQRKHATTIGDRAFIGCNVNLVAPLVVGEAAYLAAGSTITRDVPELAMAIGRERQVVKEGYARRWLSEKPK